MITSESLGFIYPEAGRLLNAAPPGAPEDSSSWKWIAGISALVGAAGLAYHGYQRSGSAPAAIGWGILGAIFPINFIAGGVAVAQGYGKKKGAR